MTSFLLFISPWAQISSKMRQIFHAGSYQQWKPNARKVFVLNLSELSISDYPSWRPKIPLAICTQNEGKSHCYALSKFPGLRWTNSDHFGQWELKIGHDTGVLDILELSPQNRVIALRSLKVFFESYWWRQEVQSTHFQLISNKTLTFIEILNFALIKPYYFIMRFFFLKSI